jgi:hypothetical protein
MLARTCVTGAPPDNRSERVDPQRDAAAPASIPRATPLAPTPPSPNLVAPPKRRRWARFRQRRILVGGIGAIVGGLSGSVVGLVMLAFTLRGNVLTAISDPVSLWRSVGDSRLKFMSVAVTLGAALLGAALAAFVRTDGPEWDD